MQRELGVIDSLPCPCVTQPIVGAITADYLEKALLTMLKFGCSMRSSMDFIRAMQEDINTGLELGKSRSVFHQMSLLLFVN